MVIVHKIAKRLRNPALNCAMKYSSWHGLNDLPVDQFIGFVLVLLPELFDGHQSVLNGHAFHLKTCHDYGVIIQRLRTACGSNQTGRQERRPATLTASRCYPTGSAWI